MELRARLRWDGAPAQPLLDAAAGHARYAAVVSLHRALDQLDDRAGKQRSVVLLDLAAAHAATDAEHGMDFAEQAFDQLKREPYGTAYGRIPAVLRALEGTPQARVLDERMRSLPAAAS